MVSRLYLLLHKNPYLCPMNCKCFVMKQAVRWGLCVACWCCVLLAGAQNVQPKFGYLSYNAVFQAMPEYAAAQQKLTELKAKYDAEARRGEEEFQRKFVEFLQGQKDFPENILQKRQFELQDLLDKSIRFKDEAQKLLSQAEQELQADMLYLLNEAIRAVGVERGYAFIINTDGNACPFINPVSGDDVTNYVKEKLQLPISVEPNP